MNAITSNRPLAPRVAQMEMTRTGLRIGIQTIPRQRIEVTQDAARVQAALLAKPRSPDFWPVAVGAACAVGLVVMHFAGWLPGGGA